MTTFVRSLLLALVLLVAAAPAGAGDATFRSPPREGYVNVPSTLVVELRNASSFEPPALPQVDGLTIALGEARHTATSVTIINGRQRQSVTQTLEIQITPQREGRFSVPAISIQVDGATFTSQPFTLVAKTSDSTGLLIAEIVADPPNPFVGQATKLTLRILIKPYKDPTRNIVLNGSTMWSLLDPDRCSWGPFQSAIIRLAQQQQRPADRQRVRDNATYLAYEIDDVWTPTQAGPPAFDRVVIAMNWPTGVEIGQDIFMRNSAEITGVRPIQASAVAQGIDVRPLPDAERPASFTGAVGDFVVSAEARPTEVAVGDPITVVYTVKSAARDNRSVGSLETLQAPAFASLPALAGDFRIPADQLGGTVRGSEKTFTQTFRPLRDGITQIPPIPFGFFDPEAGTYREVASEAIPITVKAAERMGMSEIVGAIAGAASPDRAALTTVAGGLVANLPPTTALLGSTHVTLGSAVAGAVALPPALCTVLLVMRRVQERRDANPQRIRAARAASTAEGILASARSGGEAEAILSALTGFIADRCALADGARTRGDAVRALADGEVDEGLRRRVDELLATCERARYAPAGSAGPSVAEARALLAALGAAKLGPRRAVVTTGGAA